MDDKKDSDAVEMREELAAGRVCAGCLSIGRRTTSLTPALEHLFSTLLCDAVHGMDLVITSNIVLCWECTAVLKKTLRFAQCATKAQKWLLWAKNNLGKSVPSANNISMSSLQISSIFDPTIKLEGVNVSTIKVTTTFDEDIEYNVYEDEPYVNCYDKVETKDFSVDLESPEIKPVLKIEIDTHLENKPKLRNKSAHIKNSKEIERIECLEEKKRKNRLPGQMFEKVPLDDKGLLKMREEARNQIFFSNAPYKCETCVTGFISMVLYQRHNSKYHSAKLCKTTCDICKRRIRRRDLERHVGEHYTSYKCRVCARTFLDRQTSYRHYKSLHERKATKYKRLVQIGEMYETVTLTEADVAAFREADRTEAWYLRAPYKCETCIKGFHAESRFDYHQRKHHSLVAGELMCAICLARHADKKSLTQHLEGHFRCYRCNVCAAKFSARLTAYRHYNNIHRLGKTYNCKYCTATFNKRFERKEHLKKTHKTFPCPKCQKEFKYQKVLQKHMESHAPLACAQCGRACRTQRALREHAREHGHEREHEHEQLAEAYCVECDKHFRSRKDYSNHITVKHTYADRVFPCSDCDKTFKRKLVLKNHYNMVHLKKNNFQCDQCEKCFVNRAVLNHHKAFVHERRPKPKKHICDICSRGFSGKTILDNHRRTHTGERPFLCHCCSAAFTQKVALIYHVRRIHLKGKSAADAVKL